MIENPRRFNVYNMKPQSSKIEKILTFFKKALNFYYQKRRYGYVDGWATLRINRFQGCIRWCYCPQSDTVLNLAPSLAPLLCKFDRCTCGEGLEYDCGSNEFDCLDPTAPADCPAPSPTLAPAAVLGYPDCTGYMYSLQNGYCDSDLNNDDCGESAREQPSINTYCAYIVRAGVSK